MLEARLAPATVTWVGGSGDWNTVSNWSDGTVNRLPGATDDAVINTAGITVTHSSGSHTVRSITSNAAFNLTGGTLTVTGTVQDSSPLTLAGGTLAQATVAAGTTVVGTASPTYSPAPGGALVGVTLAGTLDLTGGQRVGVAVYAGLTLSNGVVNIGGAGNANWGYLQFSGSQTLGGTGTITFGSGPNQVANAVWVSDAGTTLTIASGITIHGVGGEVGFESDTGTYPYAVGSTNVAIINQGKIDADGGGSLTVYGTGWRNDTGGVLQVENGGTLNMDQGQSGRSWSNRGTIKVNDPRAPNPNPNSSLVLGGSVSTPNLGTISRTSGNVYLTGSLDNTNSTLTLDAAAGPWVLATGTISGGVVATSGGAALVGTASPTYSPAPGGALVGVTLAGTLDLTGGQRVGVAVYAGLTLSNGVVNIGGAGNANWGYLQFSGSQTLGGTGTITFGSGPNRALNSLWVSDAGTTLTLAAGITVHGGGFVGYNSNTSTYPYAAGSTNVAVVNQGTINSDTSGGSITIDGTGWRNDPGGLVEAQAGAALSLGQPATGRPWSNLGAVSVSGGTLSLGGGAWSNGGTVSATNATVNLGGSFSVAALGSFSRTGGTVNLTGSLSNAGATLTLDAAMGSWVVSGGSISGGTVATSGGSALVVAGTSTATPAPAGTLSGVTLAGTLDLTGGTKAGLTVTGGLTLSNGVVNLGGAGNANWGYLQFSGSQSLAGTGTVIFGNGSNRALNSVWVSDAGTTLIIGSGITVHGGGGFVGYNSNTSTYPYAAGSTNVAVANQGTINSDTAGGVITIDGTNWRNDSSGQVKATGGTLNLGQAGTGRSWSNLGTITLTSGTLNLGGAFNTSGLGAVSRSGGTINLVGALSNAGATLTLDAAMGSWVISGGSIGGGTVATSGGSALVGPPTSTGTPASGGTLSGVTLAGTLDLTGGTKAGLTVTGGLTLSNGVVNLGGAGNANWGYLQFSGSQSLAGTGTVTFGNGSNGGLNAVWVSNAGTTLTVGPGVTVHGGTGFVGFDSNTGIYPYANGSSNVTVVNQGTISADTGGTITEFGTNSQIASTGVMQAQNGGTMTIQGTLTNFSSGTLTGGTWKVFANSTLRLINSGITTNAATILLDGANSNFYRDTGTTSAFTGLATNAAGGTFTVQNGRTLTTAGAFTNNGRLVAGPAGKFQVTGNYTQSAAATLETQLGGSPGGGQFGQLVATGTAALAGTLSVTLVNGFGPHAGDSFQVWTFASHSGTFASITGLTAGREQLLRADVNPGNVTVTALLNAADLSMNSISAPASALAGQVVSVTYTVRNLQGTPTSESTWVDSVYLSSDNLLDSSDKLLGRVNHAGTVGGNASYTETLTAPLPGVIGPYHVMVVTDSRGLVPDVNRGNNTAVAAGVINVGVTALTLGQPLSGSVASGQYLYYRLDVPAGVDVRVGLAFVAPAAVAMSSGYQYLPDVATFDQVAFDPTQQSPSLDLLNTRAGTYYLLLHGREGLAGSLPFTLTARQLGFEIDRVSPSRATNIGTSTVTVHGSHFTAATAVSLVSPGGTVYPATHVVFRDSNTLYATFDFTGLTPGAFDVRVSDGAQSNTATAALTVSDGRIPGQLAVTLDVPRAIRFRQQGFVTVTYRNIGETDLPVSSLLLEVNDAFLRLPGDTLFLANTVLFPDTTPGGPADVLPPGAGNTIRIDYLPTFTAPHTPITFSLYDPPPAGSPYRYTTAVGLELHANSPGLLAGLTGDGPLHVVLGSVVLDSPVLGVMETVQDNGEFRFEPLAAGTQVVHFTVQDRTGLTSDFTTVIVIRPPEAAVIRRTSDGVTPGDPNEIIGPAGFGTPGFLTPDETLPYTIFFENQPGASAPAQVVTVTQQLDPDLDYSTFQMAAFGFGGLVMDVPGGLPPGLSYATRIDARTTLGVFVDVTAGIDLTTGLATWTFTSIDPATLDVPIDVLTGFLPPDTTPPVGEAFVSYTVRPRSSLASGTRLDARATVVFDQNDPLDTPAIFNTIDSGPPTSSVSPLPAVTRTTDFPVGWSGADDTGGSGIAFYDVYVSDNGGPFTPLLMATTQTSATFSGTDGHTYGFYSVASDNLGHRQPTPAAAQASTLVQTQAPTSAQLASDHPSGSVYGQAVVFTASVSATGPAPGTPTGTVQFLIDGTPFGSPLQLVSGSASVTTTALTAGSHTVTAAYTSDSPDFEDSASAPLTQLVARAALTVRADDKTAVYGSAIPTLTGSITGLENGDPITASYSTPATAGSPAGSYDVTPALSDPDNRLGNYDTSIVHGTLTITRADQAITFGSLADRTFGDADFTLAATASSGLAVSYTAAGNAIIVSGNIVHLTGAGSATITAHQPGDANYNAAADVAQTFAIARATAGVTLGGLSATYDGSAHFATASTSPAGLDVVITYSRNGQAVTDPTGSGTFDVTAAVSDANYQGGAAGTLVIHQATPTLTWDTPSDVVYGIALGGTQLDASASVPGTFSYTVGAAPAPGLVLHAGDGQLLTAAFTPDDTIDYTSASAGVSINVLKAGLTVSADAKEITYGDALPPYTVSYAGFVNGDTAGGLGGTLSFSGSATTAVDAGPYTITPGGLTSADYDITFIDGTLTVAPAPLTVTVDSAWRFHGQPNPTFTGTVTGIENGDAITAVYSSSADESSPPGLYDITATLSGARLGDYAVTVHKGTLEVVAQVETPASLSGVVFADFNDDGQVDFGEQGIAGVPIRLTGTDDLGQPIDRTQPTDADGAYVFLNLRPGDYTLSEPTQPVGYTQGVNSVGTGGGTAVGDQFFVRLAEGADTLNYNFGERPAATGTVQHGQTAGIGFWNNKNGQALIRSLGGGAQDTQLGNWLAATFPNMFGASAGANDLAGRSNAGVAAFFQSRFVLKGEKLDAQVLATALAVYVTNPVLNPGRAGAQYGFVIAGNGVGTASYNVGSSGAAFGVANNTTMTVLDLLRAADAQAVQGVLYNGNKQRRDQANAVFSALNQAGDVG